MKTYVSFYLRVRRTSTLQELPRNETPTIKMEQPSRYVMSRYVTSRYETIQYDIAVAIIQKWELIREEHQNGGKDITPAAAHVSSGTPQHRRRPLRSRIRLGTLETPAKVSAAADGSRCNHSPRGTTGNNHHDQSTESVAQCMGLGVTAIRQMRRKYDVTEELGKGTGIYRGLSIPWTLVRAVTKGRAIEYWVPSPHE